MSNNFEQLDAHTVGVRIAPETTLGEAALIYFMRRIPRPIRQQVTSLRWDGDYWRDGERWGRIRITKG